MAFSRVIRVWEEPNGCRHLLIPAATGSGYRCFCTTGIRVLRKKMQEYALHQSPQMECRECERQRLSLIRFWADQDRRLLREQEKGPADS